MVLIVIACIIIAIVLSLIIFLITIYNKYQMLIIKINKGEDYIFNSLENKYNILLKYLDFFKDNITIDEEDFEEYKLLNTKTNIDKLNTYVNNFNNLINRYMDNNEDLYKKDTIASLNDELFNANLSINSSKNYYNNYVTKYNNQCHTFPSNIVAKIFKYKEKNIMNEDNIDGLKILNDNDNEKNNED